MPDRTPHDSQVWSDPSDGRPMLFVRTEKVLGRDAYEHHFVKTSDRVVFHRRLPDGAMPDGFELMADPDATERAKVTRDLMAGMERHHRAELKAVRRKVRALETAMRRAVAVVSPTVGDELRRVYSEALGGQLTREPGAS